ncbi:hypothetical protein LSH36_919g01021 [Paralvinella palmiformis]|uniref:Uncharacterized protein n=1 Tax=Paralvinella palmiformis TaxID=53620 RepID=A0AAD9IY71_9ANNE|nr:hypothetical protein LSH36_919g01021 [Paralvinella palmiformis]
MDGWMDGLMDGWMDGWTYGRTDGRMDGPTDGPTDKRADDQTDGGTGGTSPCGNNYSQFRNRDCHSSTSLARCRPDRQSDASHCSRSRTTQGPLLSAPCAY